jgi:hypothetical protein
MSQHWPALTPKHPTIHITDLPFDVLSQLIAFIKRLDLPATARTCRVLYELVMPRMLETLHLSVKSTTISTTHFVDLETVLDLLDRRSDWLRKIKRLYLSGFMSERQCLKPLAPRLVSAIRRMDRLFLIDFLHCERLFNEVEGLDRAITTCESLTVIRLNVGYSSPEITYKVLDELKSNIKEFEFVKAKDEPDQGILLHLGSHTQSLVKFSAYNINLTLRVDTVWPNVTSVSVQRCPTLLGMLPYAFPNAKDVILIKNTHDIGDVDFPNNCVWKSLSQLRIDRDSFATTLFAEDFTLVHLILDERDAILFAQAELVTRVSLLETRVDHQVASNFLRDIASNTRIGSYLVALSLDLGVPAIQDSDSIDNNIDILVRALLDVSHITYLIVF